LQTDGQVFFWLLGTGEGASPFALSATGGATSRLPKLLHKQEQRAQSSVSEEPMISLYEKGRKTLLLKRREGEKQLKMKKKSMVWRKINQIQNLVLTAMEDAEARAEEEAAKAPA
jgi:hypothetical protein